MKATRCADEHTAAIPTRIQLLRSTGVSMQTILKS